MPDRLLTAMNGLALALDAPLRPGPQSGTWRFNVRQQLVGVRDGLAHEAQHTSTGAIDRDRSVLRERQRLLSAIATVAPRVLDGAEPERLRVELKRLLLDIDRHRRYVRDGIGEPPAV